MSSPIKRHPSAVPLLVQVFHQTMDPLGQCHRSVGSGNGSVVSKDALLPGFAEIPANGPGPVDRGSESKPTGKLLKLKMEFLKMMVSKEISVPFSDSMLNFERVGG